MKKLVIFVSILSLNITASYLDSTLKHILIREGLELMNEWVSDGQDITEVDKIKNFDTLTAAIKECTKSEDSVSDKTFTVRSGNYSFFAPTGHELLDCEDMRGLFEELLVKVEMPKLHKKVIRTKIKKMPHYRINASSESRIRRILNDDNDEEDTL